jgi:hypothetical protein
LRRVDPAWAENQILTGLSTGEGLIWSVRDPEAKKSKTKEQSEDVVVSVLDKRVLVLQSEFASVLRVQRREGNTLSAILRNAWDSGTMGILTKNSPVKATGGHVSIIGHITEDELRKELTATDEANGYANRFLFVCASRSKQLPLGGDVKEEAICDLVQRLTKARRFAMNVDKMYFSTNATKLTALNPANIRAVQFAEIGKCFLGNSQLVPLLPDGFSEPDANVVHLPLRVIFGPHGLCVHGL